MLTLSTCSFRSIKYVKDLRGRSSVVSLYFTQLNAVVQVVNNIIHNGKYLVFVCVYYIANFAVT